MDSLYLTQHVLNRLEIPPLAFVAGRDDNGKGLLQGPTEYIFYMLTSARLFYVVSVLGVTVLALACAVHGQGKVKKRAAPPKFDPREVERVFFSDARKALVGTRPMGTVATGDVKRPGSSGDTRPAVNTTAPTSSGAPAWSKLISAETLADEVKAYVPLLTEAVKTPSQFKGNGARNARRYFSTLATVFGIIAQFDGEVRWKTHAAGARQLFARAGYNAKSDNENVFKEAKLRLEDLTALLRGETIAVPQSVEPQPSYNEQVSNRPPLMWRLERAYEDRLSDWTVNAGQFNKNLNGVRHEAEMVAALAQIIQHPSYTDADSESYIEYAQALQKAAIEIRQSVERKDAAAASAAASSMKKACDNCHLDYRGG
jgi:hypothetical protein